MPPGPLSSAAAWLGLWLAGASPAPTSTSTTAPAAATAPGTLQPAAPGALCVTAGRVTVREAPGEDKALAVDEPTVRAVVPGAAPGRVELRFTYRGPTKATRPLSSGRPIEQLGLKLLSRDTCNVLYVMWRKAPEAELAVLAKLNPGQSTHAECGNRGYRRLRPTASAPPPTLETGSRHRLAATIDAQGRLEVLADDRPLWSGLVPPDVLSALNSPGAMPGLRSDNAAFTFELQVSGAPPPAAAPSRGPADCRSVEQR